MISILPDHSIHTSSNCFVHSKYKNCEITNNIDEHGYVVFPLNSYWKDEYMPSCWELTIKGKFTDNTFFRLEARQGNFKTENIYLSDAQSTFNIPVSTFDERGWNSIFFGIGKKESIIIDELKISAKEPEKGLKEVYHMTSPKERQQGRVWRKEEKGHFIATNHIKDHTIVYCNPKAENVNIDVRNDIWCKLDMVSKYTSAKIINHISNFYNYSLKERAFNRWSCFGLPIPHYEIIPESSRQQKIISKWKEKYDGFIIRVNNTESGRGIEMYDDSLLQTMKMNTEKWRRIHYGYYNTNLILTEHIPPIILKDKKYRVGGKAFIVNGRIICCVPDIYHVPEEGNALRAAWCSDPDIYLMLAKKIQNISKEWKIKMILAVSAVGLDTATLDFVIGPGGNPVFLEANSSWGLGDSHIDFPWTKELRNMLIKEKDALEPEFPDIYKRMNLNSFWTDFYKYL